MKKLLFLFVSLFLTLSAFAQLEVKKGSFKEVPGFVNVNRDENYQTDDNNLPFAVIKVRTENINDRQRRQLSFKGNAGTFIMLEYKDGEVWVYLTAKYADYLKISHPDLSSTEFALPYDLKPKHGYEMTLVNKTGMTPEADVYNYLVVTADQPNAAVYIDDVFEGEQFAQKSFMAGEKHHWRIECELYYTENGEVLIPEKEGENVTVEKELRPAFGYLNVTSSPESGAIVYIDGKKVGVTPFVTDKLASGEHKVRVMKEMYSAVEKTFTVTDGNTTQAPMTMSANFVNVTVTTDTESDIYVDNELKGKGSWSGRLSDGNHAFEARKASHRNSVENIKLTLGKNENIVIPNPTPIYGTIDISTNPIGANIIIDGKNFGTTPRVLTNVLIGTHELRLEKSGCASVAKTITLDEKNKLTISEKLQTGREIAISTDKNGDQIYVDGNYIGTSPMTTTLSFGEHNIKAVRDGKETSKKITVAQTGGETSVKLSYGFENKTFTVNGVSFEMVYVKGGTYTMGGTAEQGSAADSDEKPTHSVTLSDYYIGKFEVTQELWQAVMGNNPSYFKGNNLPVEKVSWNDVQEFIRKLNQKTGANFRLPTEAEWEYAARGGNKSNGYKYSGSNSIGDVAWYTDNSGSKTHQVGTKTPNELGIYDMSGNAWEWCQDWYGSYSSGSQTNPTGPSSGSYRVLRGGSWGYGARYCRGSNRGSNNPDLRDDLNGFRLAMDFKQTSNNSSTQTLGSINASNAGVFSVAADKKVHFSQGNLQYQASTKTWRFAEHQWDMIGDANKNISSSYSGWIDLFGWGTGNNPTKSSTSSSDYSTFTDWGKNTISNGGGKSWFTLTKDEWVYVFDKRITSSGIRYAKAIVNGVNGVILLPDNWSSSSYSLSNTNIHDASFNSNRISQTDWTNKFEANGAVFLPAAGYRGGTNVFYVGSIGYYWSASYKNSDNAYIVGFNEGDLYAGYWFYRYRGFSVRLVCSAQ